MILRICSLLLILDHATGFWDIGTTTPSFIRADLTPRQSFFRWQVVHTRKIKWWFGRWDWYTIEMNRRLRCVCGISIDFIPLGTATLLNQRTLITSANYMEPYLDRQKDLRIWCLGREGLYTTPYRYRVWRARRVLPRSVNSEHWHGPSGLHVPRHDISIIHSWDQIYMYTTRYARYHYPYKAIVTKKHDLLGHDLWFAGSGYEYLEHIAENYKIFWSNQTRDEIVDCSKYLPKWWGKFICIINSHGWAGVPNGGGLYVAKKGEDTLVGLGCFEIRYNEERIMAFTDLRYYVDWIHIFANISRGEYYEYAYPEWSIKTNFIYDGHGNYPYIPRWQIKRLRLPLGRK